tara:strand:+ start:26796 stop:27047 length:252 start_codon:yes stop_codon:yes gene_type:complete
MTATRTRVTRDLIQPWLVEIIHPSSMLRETRLAGTFVEQIIGDERIDAVWRISTCLVLVDSFSPPTHTHVQAEAAANRKALRP